jgi:hypothetical protein
MTGYHLWGSTVTPGEDGKYHMFVTRWPQSVGRSVEITGSYYLHTEICRAVAHKPEGPYAFREVVLARRPGFFDAVSCHNPAILKTDRGFVLYYCGFDGATKHIGLAFSPSVSGPWSRMDAPLFPADDGNRNNPSACLRPDGKILLVFRAKRMELHAALADSYDSEYRVKRGPLLEHGTEDPCVWYNGEHFEMIVEDNCGHFTGSRLNGAHLISHDGFRWRPSEHVTAYEHPIMMDDGTRLYGRQEKPWVLRDEAGRATHLFLVKVETDAATPPAYSGELTGHLPVWNVCVPLAQE